MTSTCKTAIRSFAYAVLLGLTTLNFAPSLASGQESASGHFTLSHEVRWDDVAVPAGEYRFSIDSNDEPRVMTLTKQDASHAGFFLLVHAAEQDKITGLNRLELSKTSDGISWVNVMQLSEFGVILYFPPPSARKERQVAKAGTMAATVGQ
jgi:hypothetical protein